MANTTAGRKGVGGTESQGLGRLITPGILAGLLGGIVLAMIMMIVMGASGMGFASPLNLGMGSFLFTVVPPLVMFPSLMAAMGIALPASVASQLMTAIQSGHIPPAMASQLGSMLTAMHVPQAKLQLIAQMMSGHATNSTVASLMNQMSPAARASVMSAMPISWTHMIVGAMLHMVFSAILGVAFFLIIRVAATKFLPALDSTAGYVLAGMAGGIIVYIINRWIVLPLTNPLMAFVPQLAFFIAHLMFGMIVGYALALTVQRRSAGLGRV